MEAQRLVKAAIAMVEGASEEIKCKEEICTGLKTGMASLLRSGVQRARKLRLYDHDVQAAYMFLKMTVFESELERTTVCGESPPPLASHRRYDFLSDYEQSQVRSSVINVFLQVKNALVGRELPDCAPGLGQVLRADDTVAFGAKARFQQRPPIELAKSLEGCGGDPAAHLPRPASTKNAVGVGRVHGNGLG